MNKDITGVILAGGASKRFNGVVKSRIEIGGKPIISRITDTFHDLFDEIIIVTNSPDEYSEYSGCRITGDIFMNKGPLGGIHAAMAISENEAFFIVAGDMPLLDRELIIRQIDFFSQQTCDILIPVVGNYIEPLHGIYRKSILNNLVEYLKGDNDYAIREFFKKAEMLYFKVGDSETRSFTNINYPSDIDIVKRMLE
jgi:molybdopterin-guanine dinucleotide biosynthesis protein A